MNIRGGGGGGEGSKDVDELLSQAREEQASTLQDVEWRGRKMAVKQEKVKNLLFSYLKKT